MGGTYQVMIYILLGACIDLDADSVDLRPTTSMALSFSILMLETYRNSMQLYYDYMLFKTKIISYVDKLMKFKWFRSFTIFLHNKDAIFNKMAHI